MRELLNQERELLGWTRHVSVDARGPDGSTPLVRATLWQRVEIARVLLSRGANPHTADDKGLTALDVARLVEHQVLVELRRRHMR